MDQEDIELPYHVPLSFKVGERVKVIAETKTAHAWYGEWTVRADSWYRAGTVAKVIQEDKLIGFLCDYKSEGPTWLPSCALAKAAAEVCVIEVPFISEGGN